MLSQSPRVSIGLAIYNGENYVREAIDSILGQTFEDFELIISDNASTDRTQEICLDYAARDSRIRYYRNEQNMGAAWNQTQVAKLATGEYFMLAAHDDVRAATYLEKCVAVLDRDPSVVLCHSWTRKINEHGEWLEDQKDGCFIPPASNLANLTKRLFKPLFGDGKLHADSWNPRERFRGMLCTYNSCYHIFGVIRNEVLKQTFLFTDCCDADLVLLTKLALIGRFYDVPEYLFLSRRHPLQSEAIISEGNDQCLNEYIVWWNPANAGKIAIPSWRAIREYWQVVSDAPISWHDRLWCYFDVLRRLRGTWRYVAEETFVAVRRTLSLWLGPKAFSQKQAG
ncbi:MAG: glycosyltransferase [Kovacikia sp.]